MMYAFRWRTEPHANQCDASQTHCFKAATGKAFTIVRAGFAFTVRISPKISFVHALVAGLWRVLILHRPGKVKMPFFWTSLVAIAARLEMIFPAVLDLSSHSSAIARERPPLLRGFPATLMALAFIGLGVAAFMGLATFMGFAAATFMAFMGLATFMGFAAAAFIAFMAFMGAIVLGAQGGR